MIILIGQMKCWKGQKFDLESFQGEMQYIIGLKHNVPCRTNLFNIKGRL